MLSPGWHTGALARQNGPNKPALDDSFSLPGGLLSMATKVDTPNKSNAKMTSFLVSPVSWPMPTKNLTARSNSFSVTWFSITNWCMWVLSEHSSSRRRGSGVRAMTSKTKGKTVSGVVGKTSVSVTLDMQKTPLGVTRDGR